MFGLEGIVKWIVLWYGYKSLYALLSANFGLVVILIAFMVVGAVFWRLQGRQFPTSGRQPVKTWIFKVTMIFFICGFIFISVFTIFYEKKKMEESRIFRQEQSLKINPPV